MPPFPDEIPHDRVHVCSANPAWADEGLQYCAEVRAILGLLAVHVDHIGSTSVPGLPAKDCIDLLVRADALDEAAFTAAFDVGGYRLRPEPWNHQETTWGQPQAKLVYAPPARSRSRNVHVRLPGGPNARYALLFRDFLRTDPIARDAWGRFKIRLAQTAREIGDYGQIKQPATDVLMRGAEAWALATGWEPR